MIRFKWLIMLLAIKEQSNINNLKKDVKIKILG